MSEAMIDGIRLRHDLSGYPTGRPVVITPGGRFGMDYSGVFALAAAIHDFVDG